MWALKFNVFCVFVKKNLRKTEKSHEILDRAMSRWRHHVKWWRLIKKQVTRSCAGENFGKSLRKNFRNLLWFRSYAAKSSPGGKFTPPPPVLCVLNMFTFLDKTMSDESEFHGIITRLEKKDLSVLFLVRGSERRRGWPRDVNSCENEKKKTIKWDTRHIMHDLKTINQITNKAAVFKKLHF